MQCSRKSTCTVITTLECSPECDPILEATLYRRALPEDCIAFSSIEGKRLFKEAINREKNYMQIYFPLAEQYVTQAEPAFCGLATLAMCLNALEIDPKRLWKGTWRWYSEELFDCCTSLSAAREKGISLSEFLCLAACNGVKAEAYRADCSFSIDQFRTLVKRSCSSTTEMMVLNYSRIVLGQTGDGHFSPVGGYHPEQDMVLLLDVARFKYPPHWVKLPLLYKALQRIDESIGLPRGLAILRNGELDCIDSPEDPILRTSCVDTGIPRKSSNQSAVHLQIAGIDANVLRRQSRCSTAAASSFQEGSKFIR